jgi:type VI protein secretion system component VasA
MRADPPLSLSEAQHRGVARIRLACAKCDRRGNYDVARLRFHFGNDAKMIAIREALAADCPQLMTSGSSFSEACGARFEW